MPTIKPISQTLAMLCGNEQKQRTQLHNLTIHCNVKRYDDALVKAVINQLHDSKLGENVVRIRERGLAKEIVFQLTYLQAHAHIVPQVSVETRQQVGLKLEEAIRGVLDARDASILVKGEVI